MIKNIANYHLKTILSETEHTVIYRATQEKVDKQVVVLKVLKNAYALPAALARFKREYQLLKQLNLTGVIKAYDLFRHHDDAVMVLEDFGGQSLKLLLSNSETVDGNYFEVGNVLHILNISLQLVDILSQIHQQNIIHKDINPANILINPQTTELKLADFGVATTLNQENTSFNQASSLEGTLAYMAPEQTGRMNRSLDYRADFYALGVTLYELLTGERPFPNQDMLELIHSHLAKSPQPLVHINSSIPQPLSDIVLKLLAKSPEDRYQSTVGLKYDLEKCRHHYQNGAKVPPFMLGQYDLSNKFQPSQKLYGREREFKILLSTFEQVCQGKTEIILISGPAGMGKSVFVQEVYKPLTRQKGYFVNSKLDIFQQNIPYAAFIQTIQSLIKQLLTQSEGDLQNWRKKLLAALGKNGQVIIDVVPDLALIIGSQPPIPPLSPAQAENRFNLVLNNFIKVFATANHPLTIFWDDLQWIDTASLKIITETLTSNTQQYLFLIGTYRQSQIDPSHPLQLTLNQFKNTPQAITHLNLQPLILANIIQFITDTLHCSSEKAAPLAQLVLSKTGGNPFFINQFLNTLYLKELISFSPPDVSNNKSGYWQWDLAKIQSQNITDNVIKMMAEHIERLPKNTRSTLELAACIGNSFSLRTLATLTKKSIQNTAKDLQQAVQQGLIFPTTESYHWLEMLDELDDDLIIEYKFAHDHIQQTLYGFISKKKKPTIHYQIACLIQKTLPATPTLQQFFDMVNQFNLTVPHISSTSELLDLARLNLTAAQKAKNAVAYNLAFDYFKKGINVLKADTYWQTNYSLMLALYSGATETAYLNTDFDTMENLAQQVLNNAQTLLDSVAVQQIQIQAYRAQNKFSQAIETGLKLLKQFNITLPHKPTQADIDQTHQHLKQSLATHPIESLVNLPKMTDSNALTILGLLTNISPAAYFANPPLFPLIVFEEIKLCLEYGNTPLSAVVYSSYAAFLCSNEKDIEQGYQFGKLALQLVDTLNAYSLKTRIVEAVNANVIHWKEHVKQTYPAFEQAYQIGLETGQFEFAAYGLAAYNMHAYWQGQSLSTLQKTINTYHQAIKQLQQQTARYWNKLYAQTVLNLQQPSENPHVLNGLWYNEDKLLPKHIKANDRTTIFYFYLNKLMLAYLFAKYPQAISYATEAEKYLDGVTASFTVPVFHLYASLAYLAMYNSANKSQQKAWKEKVSNSQNKLQTWASHAPMNHQHKFYLLKAECNRVWGEATQAREDYDQAIAAAAKYDYPNEEGLANELAAQFYIQRDQPHLARFYLQHAQIAYQRWEATAKLNQFTAQYPNLLTISQVKSGDTIHTTTQTVAEVSHMLDISSALQASQAISSEIELDKLLSKLIQIVLENAGAQRGALILLDEDRLLLEAEGSVDSKEVNILQSIPVDISDNTETSPQLKLSAEIVHYVINSKQNIILDDALKDEQFSQSPYIVVNKPKSILCTPLINQGDVIGAIYLENNLTTTAFTADRIKIVQLLATQAAISIANARTIAERAERERLHLENEFLEKETKNLAKLNADKDKFFSIVSHDLRSPFNGLIGGTEFLIESIESAPRDELKGIANIIYDAANMAFDLLEDLLDWSRLQRGSMKAKPNHFELIVPAYTTVSLLEQSAKQKNVHLENSVPDDLVVYADETMITTVIRNLISNAIKFTPEGGKITVSATPKTSPNYHVEISVKDTGVGMNKSALQKLFRIDVHYTTQGTNSEKGSGLGLIICQEMIEQNNGRIWAESTPGQGTTMYFTVPQQPPKKRD